MFLLYFKEFCNNNVSGNYVQNIRNTSFQNEVSVSLIRHCQIYLPILYTSIYFGKRYILHKCATEVLFRSWSKDIQKFPNSNARFCHPHQRKVYIKKLTLFFHSPQCGYQSKLTSLGITSTHIVSSHPTKNGSFLNRFKSK